jgi:hypothetical protein
MKEYPSIPRQAQNLPVFAFDKLDGSNIRAEWNRKTGFSKFGSRTQLIDKTHQFLGEAPDLVMQRYGKALEEIFKRERFERVTCFFEFYGPNSFAGTHQAEPHEVVLIDVDIFKKGIMKPGDFLKMFGHLPLPRLVYRGNSNQEFTEAIRQSKMDGVTEEGVVCKSNETDKYGHPIMFKVKSDRWLQRLKTYCGDNEKLFRSLE